MRISLSPQIREDTSLSVVKTGDALTINGEVFDFTSFPDGATIFTSDIPSDYIVGNNVERIDGEIHIKLLFPIPFNASHALCFPEPIEMTGDGPVPFPKDKPNVDA